MGRVGCLDARQLFRLGGKGAVGGGTRPLISDLRLQHSFELAIPYAEETSPLRERL